MRIAYFLILLTFGFPMKSFSNQEDIVQVMRNNWHSYLPTVLRLYPEYDSVENYPLSPQIHVYEPSTTKRVLIWITGNAFIFDEPESHHSFLRYTAEMTESKIYALSHRKIPEFTYTDIQNDLIASFDYLTDTKQLPDGVPVVLVGDSSGALLVTHLLSHVLEKIAVDQLLFIAPGLDMSVFLKDEPIEIESFPKESHDVVASQNQMMKLIASMLYRNGEEIDSAMEALFKIKNNMPKIHMICFEYDIFYPQALQLQSAFDTVTIDCRKRGFHGDYLVKGLDEAVANQPFLLTWGP